MKVMKKEEFESIKRQVNLITLTEIIDKIGERFRSIGGGYVMLCPFHGDTTPSLRISDDKGVWKCFSCGASGNGFSFVRQYLNLNFVETVSWFKENFGIETSGSFSDKKDVLTQLTDLEKDALNFFVYSLDMVEDEKYSNFKGRGFGLIEESSPVKSFLKRKEYPEKDIENFLLKLPQTPSLIPFKEVRSLDMLEHTFLPPDDIPKHSSWFILNKVHPREVIKMIIFPEKTASPESGFLLILPSFCFKAPESLFNKIKGNSIDISVSKEYIRSLVPFISSLINRGINFKINDVCIDDIGEKILLDKSCLKRIVDLVDLPITKSLLMNAFGLS